MSSLTSRARSQQIPEENQPKTHLKDLTVRELVATREIYLFLIWSRTKEEEGWNREITMQPETNFSHLLIQGNHILPSGGVFSPNQAILYQFYIFVKWGLERENLTWIVNGNSLYWLLLFEIHIIRLISSLGIYGFLQKLDFVKSLKDIVVENCVKSWSLP